MARANTDDGHAEHGGFVINTGTGPPSRQAVIPAGVQAHCSLTAAGLLSTVVSWFHVSTGTISATGHGGQFAGGAGSIMADGATAVNTNRAGTLHTAGALAQPCRTAGGALSDQMLWASRFLYKTCTDTMSVGGAGSVIPDRATAFNTTGTLAQPWRTAGGSDHVVIPSESRFGFKTGRDAIKATDRGVQIAAGPGSVIATGAATVNTNWAGSVLSTGAATVEINGAGAVNTADGVAQFSRTASGAFFDQILIPGAFIVEDGTGLAKPSDDLFIKTGDMSIFHFGPGLQIAGPGAIIATGAACVNTNSATSVNTYEGFVVSWPTSTTMDIGRVGAIGMLGGIGMLGIAFISRKDAIKFVRAAVEGFSLKGKVRRWTARVLKKIMDN